LTAFIDTGVLFAAADRRDRRHSDAVRLLGELSRTVAISTDHVVVETWMMLRGRYGRSQAMRFWTGLRGTPLKLESVTLHDMERAEAIASHWSDQDFDIVDCTSFAVMERLGCMQAATFDSDFAVYRFGLDRRSAFEILH